MTTHSTQSWENILTEMGLPSNGKMSIQFQNGGINAIRFDEKPLRVPNRTNREIATLVREHHFNIYRAGSWQTDSEDFIRTARNEDTLVVINFHGGIPVGKKAAYRSKQYFERGDKAAHSEPDDDLGFSIEE